MKTKHLSLLSLLLLVFTIFACESDEHNPTASDKASDAFKNTFSDYANTDVINFGACGDSASVPLLAGNQVVGKVIMSVDGNLLTLTYESTNDWVLTATQAHVGASPADIPLDTNGDPLTGQFDYQTSHTPPVNYFTYQVDVTDLGEVTIAANAVARKVLGEQSNVEILDHILPESMNLTVKFTKDPSYFETTITGSGVIDGVYPGNCIDLDHGITPGVTYHMSAVSSYSSNAALLAQLVDKPENLDLVNYLINQDYSAIGAKGSEMQAAIWTLLDDKTPTSGIGGITFNQNIVAQLVADAHENGEDYLPECDGKVMVIGNPGGDLTNPEIKEQVTMVQVQMITFPNNCQTVYSDPEYSSAAGSAFVQYCLKDPIGCEADMPVIDDFIPAEKVNVEVQFIATPSYFTTTITNGGVLDGTFEGFCVDIDRYIASGELYQMYVFSTYNNEDLLAQYVDKPQNFDLVNYVINQDYSHLNITGLEWQVVMWNLIDNREIISGTTVNFEFNQDIVDQVLADAYENGEGYVPPCDGYTAFVLDPNAGHETQYQVTFIKFPVAQIPGSAKLIY